jgi:hypothetical protein
MAQVYPFEQKNTPPLIREGINFALLGTCLRIKKTISPGGFKYLLFIDLMYFMWRAKFKLIIKGSKMEV